MMDNERMRMWEEAARLQEFRTRGRGYAGASPQDDAARAKEAAHVRHMEDTIKANGARLDAERAAAIKATQQAKPLKDILTNQGDYDMKDGPDGRQKPTLDPKEQAARAMRAQRKNSK